MNCSVKFFVPMRIGGSAGCAGVGGAARVCVSSPPPPQPIGTAAATAKASRAGQRRRTALSIWGSGSRARRSLGHLQRDVRPVCPRDREVEDAPLAGRAGDPGPAAVLADDPLADRKADARALVVLLTVEALEGLEDPLGVLRFHADPVVPDGEAPHAVLVLGLDAHHGMILAREL